jgi:transcriptional regulator with XRE-family HTH domain
MSRNYSNRGASDEEKKIFADRLNYYLAEHGMTQTELAKKLGFNQTTVNMWCNGNSMPTAGKVQLIADFFHIGKSDLIEKPEFINPGREAQFITYQIINNPMLNELFSLAIDVKPSDLQPLIEMLRRITAYQEKLSDIKPKRLSDYKD